MLAEAEHCRQATDGFFDVTAAPRTASAAQATARSLLLNDRRQTVRFSSAEVAIDLGGIGKGFALDRAKHLLARYGVEIALLSAGTSSILAVGRPAAGEVWSVDVRHPADDAAGPIGRVELVDRSLSCSATLRPGQTVSDIVDPHTRLPLAGGEAVVVLASTGVWAELAVDVTFGDGPSPGDGISCPWRFDYGRWGVRRRGLDRLPPAGSEPRVAKPPVVTAIA